MHCSAFAAAQPLTPRKLKCLLRNPLRHKFAKNGFSTIPLRYNFVEKSKKSWTKISKAENCKIEIPPTIKASPKKQQNYEGGQLINHELFMKFLK